MQPSINDPLVFSTAFYSTVVDAKFIASWGPSRARHVDAGCGMLRCMEHRIRPATAADAPIVGRFIHRLIIELEPERSMPPHDHYGAVAHGLLSDGHYWAWLAEGDGEPVGVLTVTESRAVYADGVFGEIVEFYIAPTARAGGLGRQMVETALAFAHARGWRRLEVSAPEQPRWARTLAFYRAQGFIDNGPRLKRLIPEGGISAGTADEPMRRPRG